MINISPYTDPYSCQDSILDTIPEIVWFDSRNKFPADPKRLKQEEDETLEQVSKQLKQGIIKKRHEMNKGITINDNQNIKDLIQRVTVPLITKIKNVELFGPCFCGCKEHLIECKDCLKSLQMKK